MNDSERRTILIVEDEYLIAAAEKKRLEGAGYRAIHCGSGEEAIRLAGEAVDLILLDIDLGPGIDGTQAAIRILADRDVPILFLSSHLEKDIVEKTEKITNYGYVVKNSSFTVLDASIKMAFKLFEANRAVVREKIAPPLEYHVAWPDGSIHAVGAEEGERKYRSLFEHMNKGCAYCRMIFEGGEPVDFVYLEVNRFFGPLTGLRDVAGKRASEAIPGITERDSELFRIYGRVASTGESEVFEMFVESLGDWYSVSVYSPEKEYFVAVFDVITERKKAEEALRASEEKFRSLVRDMQVGILLQAPDASVLLCNPRGLELLGVAEEEILGKASFDEAWKVVGDEGLPLPAPLRPAPLAIATRLPVLGVVMGIYRPARDDRVWLSVNAVPQLDEAGEVRQVVCSFVDITARRLADDKVQGLLHEKELILKEVHHRIKNNMNTVASLLRLQSDEQADPALRGILQDAGSRVQSMMVLYDKLYRSDNADELSLRVYLLSLLDEIAGIFPTMGSIRVQTEIEDMVLGTKILSPLGMIVNELVTNAIKHAFAGRDGGLISIGAAARGGRVTIVFEDDGIGLPESVTFEHTASFGMQLIKMLVDQIRGTISIERGRGTRYVIGFDA